MSEPSIAPKKLRWLALLIPLVVIVGVVLFIRHLNSPEAVPIKSTEKTVNNTLYYSVDLTPIKQSGSFASFNRPKGLRLVSSSLNNPATSLESFDYYAKDVYSWSLAINVITTSSGLSELSDYAIRIKDPNTYSLSQDMVNNQQIPVFTDKTFVSGFNKVAFLSHGNEIATVSLIGDDSSGVNPLTETFNMVLSSWVWK